MALKAQSFKFTPEFRVILKKLAAVMGKKNKRPVSQTEAMVTSVTEKLERETTTLHKN